MDSILSQLNHRPWPLPNGPWVMAQEWCDLLFAHWPIPIALMRALVPRQLPLDTWDGQAWVGVVPFRMQGVRPRFVPSMPWLSAFPELNVRTYVKVRDRGIEKPGVYFFSLEAANPLAVMIARQVFQLPYYNAVMSLKQEDEQIHYTSRRTHRGAPAAELVGSYGPTSPIYASEPGSFEAWLTERYALYTTGLSSQGLSSLGLSSPKYKSEGAETRERPIAIGEIHHIRWPLQQANATFHVNQLAAASGLTLPPQPPILHFVRHIKVVVWPLRKVEP